MCGENGAASSNHADTMWSYFPTLTALMPLGRKRASLESWTQGGHESGGTYGQMVEAMGCVRIIHSSTKEGPLSNQIEPLVHRNRQGQTDVGWQEVERSFWVD